MKDFEISNFSNGLMALVVSAIRKENRMIKGDKLLEVEEDGRTILKHLTRQLASLKMEC